jgi:hypothetical protein
MREFTIELRSELPVPADEVWSHAATMDGVNYELAPWVRMTAPAQARSMRLADVEPRREAFVSTLLFLGALPFDRHHLTLESVLERGFDEESWSWLQRRWRHERRIAPAPDGCVVTDRVTVASRLAPAFIVKPLVRWLFSARHRKLRHRFRR